jgi:putative zinc finger protein
MTCERARELFVEGLYGELSPDLQHEFSAHVDACPSCAPELQKLKQTLSIMSQRRVAEPGEGFGGALWNKINARLGEEGSESQGPIPAGRILGPGKKIALRPPLMPAWAYGIAATILLAVGIYLGRTYFSTPRSEGGQRSTPLALVPAPESEDSTTREAVAYLQRSKNLLIGLTNLDEEHRTSLDLRHNQEVSRQLIEQGSILTVSLNKPSQQQIRQLILDLEVILLQLANIEVKPGVRAIEMVQNGLDQKSILLKINLEEMRSMARKSPGEQTKKTTL